MTHGSAWKSSALPAVGTGVAYLGLASAALLWTLNGQGIATVWPAAGLAVAVLTSVERRHAPAHLVAMAAASLLANLACGIPVPQAVIFTVANMVEALLAAALLSRCPFGAPSFVDVRQVARFCGVATVAAVASTAIASGAMGWADPSFSLSWLATDLLGILIAAPLTFLVFERMSRRSSDVGGNNGRRLALAVGLVLVAAVATFAQNAFPLLFLPLAALLGAAYATGPLGAATGALVIALVGSIAIPFGVGPTVLVQGGYTGQAFFLQFFLLVSLASALCMAALQAARERLVADLAERNRLLFMAERVAQIGHWHLDLESSKVAWSDEVFRIHGLAPGSAPNLDAAIAAYHPDDRDALVSGIEGAIRTGSPLRFRLRIVRPGGDVRHIDVTAEVVMAAGTARSLFGVVQDVTAQVETEMRLEAERQEALHDASTARTLAETDPLTGLANRRRFLDALSQAMAETRTSNRPCSMAMLDIDHFKHVNDTYGHQAGDVVLRRVAGSALRAIRSGDLVGRLGGEEFAVLLPGTTSEDAAEIAERIRVFVQIDGAGGDIDPKVTTSIGVATLREGEGPDAWMRRADQALYRAKAEGRNTSRLAA